MLPHVLGTARARSRIHETGALAAWLEGELRLIDPGANPDSLLKAASALHPLDRSAFLHALLGDPGFLAVLGDDSITELVERFEGELPGQHVPIIFEGDRAAALAGHRTVVQTGSPPAQTQLSGAITCWGTVFLWTSEGFAAGTTGLSIRPRGP